VRNQITRVSASQLNERAIDDLEAVVLHCRWVIRRRERWTKELNAPVQGMVQT
jgi:hypothetical protein